MKLLFSLLNSLEQKKLRHRVELRFKEINKGVFPFLKEISKMKEHSPTSNLLNEVLAFLDFDVVDELFDLLLVFFFANKKRVV